MSPRDPATLVVAERRDRCLVLMATAGVDALVLSRPAHVRYVAGARRVWTAGVRAAQPACVAVAAGAVHVMGIGDAALPDDIARTHRHAARWDDDSIVEAVMAIDGVAGARVVGVDGVTPALWQMLAARLPRATVVGAQPLMRAARAVKTPNEVTMLRRAVAACEAAVEETVQELTRGAADTTIRAGLFERAARRGGTVAAMPGTIATAVHDGSGVMELDVAVLLDGYEGGVGRTFPIPWGRRLNDGERAAGRRWSEAWRAVTAQCRPGRTGADLRRACTSAGASPQGDSWLVSVGIGVEGPFGEKERLAEGMVLSVGLSVVEGDLRLYARETVLVTPTGADPLCRAAGGPLVTPVAARPHVGLS